VTLFSPQIYHQLHGGSSTIDGADVCMRLFGRRPNITIPIACGVSNLPCVYNLCVSEKVKQEYASKMRSALKASRLFTALDFFGEMPFTMPAQYSDKVEDMTPKKSRQRALNHVLQCVGSVDNENLTTAQRELLLWHWKLGIGMQRILAMMRDQHYEDHQHNDFSHGDFV
jgi:hypothetical protein